MKKSLWSVTLASQFLLLAGNLHAERHSLGLDHAAEIGDGIAWFVPRGYNQGTNPSLALASEPREKHFLPAAWRLTPDFFTENQKTCAVLKVPKGSSLYGTGEVSGP